ncbi:MAG TPA: hypothetical protein VHW25_13125 [Steroidobacteraceae bacterium]|jgi:hypothetical protein|nr:hypothetical protein [Steroidobacteraceae bacterium]
MLRVHIDATAALGARPGVAGLRLAPDGPVSYQDRDHQLDDSAVRSGSRPSG